MNASTPYEFYQNQLRSPKYVVAPMVEASELPWRLLSRRYGAELCYTPMLHASVFVRDANYRKEALASCAEDRPLIIQFCGNSPDVLYKACKLAENYCDAIDLNLGCPQGIAKRGHYGAFLQDEWDLIENIVKRCSKDVKVPFTAKIRVFPEFEKTMKYAKMLESAGCAILTVHGRTREQKGPQTGLADWSYVKAIKEALSIPVFSNGNIQYLEDVHRCIDETGVDGVMIAEGSLHNPALFKGIQPLVWDIALEYVDLAEKYPCPLSCVRGHLFKLFQHALSVHTSLRPKLACARNLGDIRKVINAIKTASQPDVEKGIEGYTGDLPHPYWFCQPYVRPPPVQKTESKPDSNDTSVETKPELENIKRSHSPSTGEQDLSKNKLKKLKRNPNKSFVPSGEKFIRCGSCSNPKGMKCDFLLCKKCCKTKVYLTGQPCVGHKHKGFSNGDNLSKKKNQENIAETTQAKQDLEPKEIDSASVS